MIARIAAETSSSSRRNEVRTSLHDGHRAAEAAIHLCELEADVAAADDEQMLGQEIDVHHGGVGVVGDLIEAGHVGNGGAAADVDENPRRFEQLDRRRARTRGATKRA